MGIYDSRVEQARRDVSRLRDKIAALSGKVATERGRASDARTKASKASSSSSRTTYERDAARAEDRANQAERDRSRVESELARKEKQLFAAMSDLDKDRTRKDADRLASLERQLRRTAATRSASPLSAMPTLSAPPTLPESPTKSWDFFLSHAGADKDEIVRALAQRLSDRGARVWYDEFELTVGDSLRAKIDEGLARSRYGLVVLTSAYLQGRRWTEEELNGLFATQKRILPIWHDVSHDEVAAYSPMLADRVALLTALESLDAIADKLVDLLAA